MKIFLVVTDSFCANLIRGQAFFLVQQGHEVIVISKKGSEIMELCAKERCRHIELNFVKDISLFNDIATLIRIIKIICKEKPDLINVGNPKPGFLFALTRFFFPRQIYIFTLRGLRSETLRGLKKQIVLFTEWLTCLLVDKVIVISPSLLERARSLGICSVKKSLVLHCGSSNGIDLYRFRKTESNTLKAMRLRKMLHITESDFVFLYIGRMAKDKGIEELCKAFKKIQSDKVKLIVAGPPEIDDPVDSKTLKALSNDNQIIIFNKVKCTEILYSLADTFVIFSHREGFGNVALEAAAMELPVIVTDIPGLRDTAINNYTGLIVKNKNIEDMAQAMCYYMKNKAIAKLHGQNGRRRAEKCFDSNIIRRKQLLLYNFLLNTK